MTAPGMVQYPAGYNFPVASVARWILKTIQDEFAAAATTLPNRQLLTIGSVAIDAPLLAVMFGGISLGPPGNELNVPLRGDSPRTAVFNIELWRTEPSIGPSGMIPTEAEESAAAEVVMHDAWLLAEAVGKSDQLGVGVIWRVAVNEPQGGMVGSSVVLELQIP